MNNTSFLRFLLLFSFFIPCHAQAFSNKYVTDWTQETLMQTLSVSYRDKPEDSTAIQNKYSLAAWEPMSNFFSKELKIINEQKLTIHPQPLTQPTITRLEQCASANCWKVNQAYNLPELHMNLDFSLLIVSAAPAHQSPFIIQSANIKVHHY